MDQRIIRIARVLGIPVESPNWAPGDAWYEDPTTFRMLSRIAAVMEYVEAEFGLQDHSQREELNKFLHDLHSAFCHRLARGERLGEIAFSPDALEDYGTSLKDKVPAGLLVERLRRQFDDT